MLPSGGIDTYPTNPYVNDPVDFTNSKSTPATPDNKGLFPLRNCEYRKMSSSSFFECANWAFHKVFQFCQSRIPFLCRWRRERIFGDLFHPPTWTVFLLQRLYSHCLQQVFSNQSQRPQHHWSRGKGTRKSQKIWSRKSNTKIIWFIEYSLLRVLVMNFFSGFKRQRQVTKIPWWGRWNY